MTGLFISFEGSEGCGKSTQIRRLAERLEAAGHAVRQTREPGGTPLGEAIRGLLQHDEAGEGMTPEAELLLFAASRAQLTRRFIAPALERGEIVLCDRFMDSTTVYQGVARRLDPLSVAAINTFAVDTVEPQLTLLLDLDAETGLARARAASEQTDRMERESIDFFNAVRNGYLQIAAADPERIQVIDAGQSVEAVEQAVWTAVEPHLR
ncbi:MAG: dTMP kinase [Opitutales bacterium]